MLAEIKVAIAIGIVLLSVFAYHWIGNKAVDEYKVEVAAAQAKADRIQQDKYNKLADDYEGLKAKRSESAKVYTKTVEKVVVRDVYHNVCIDNDGLSVANAAIKGSVDSSKPVTKMQSPE